MSIRFNNKVVVITGAARGLGKCYALEFARRGAKVVVNDLGTSEHGDGFSRKSALDVVELIKVSGGEAVADYNSVADEDSAKNIIRTAVDNYGTVDILVNNAGILRDRSIDKMSAEDFDLVLKVHLYGSYYTTKAAFPIMKEKKYGRIIMTTSVAGLYGNFGQANYGSSKLGIVGLMSVFKEEGKKYNICANTIAPLADSRLGKGILSPEILERIKPEYVSAAVLFLCSDRCTDSGYIVSAGGGYFSRVQIVEGQGYCFASDQKVTPEMFEDKHNEITDMSKSKNYENATEAVMTMLRKTMIVK